MTKKILLAICVMSSMHSGYRRADFAFEKGDNELEVTPEQLERIKQDCNLLVLSEKTIEPSDDSSNISINILPSLDDIKIDLSNAPEELHQIIAAIHAKNCHIPLVKKPNCDVFGELKVSAEERDSAWEWYQENVVSTEFEESE